MNESLRILIPYFVMFFAIGLFSYIFVKKNREKIGLDKYHEIINIVVQKVQLKIKSLCTYKRLQKRATANSKAYCRRNSKRQ